MRCSHTPACAGSERVPAVHTQADRSHYTYTRKYVYIHTHCVRLSGEGVLTHPSGCRHAHRYIHTPHSYRLTKRESAGRRCSQERAMLPPSLPLPASKFI